MKHMRLLLPLLLMACAGCSAYSPAPRQHRDDRSGVTVRLPSDWRHYRTDDGNYVLTAHGLDLDRILLFSRRFDEALPGTERKYHSQICPLEAADLSLGLIAISEAAVDFQVRRIAPARVAGQPGYVAEADYRNAGGVPTRLRVYGLLQHESLIEFRLTAARDGYFERAAAQLDELASGATLRSQAQP